MTPQEAEFRVRKEIGQPDPVNSRFTPGDMLQFFNNAVSKIAFDTKDLNDEYTDLTEVGKEEYILPENTIAVHWIRVNNRPVYKRDNRWLDEHYYGWPSFANSTPKFYYHKRTREKLRSIGLFPKPDTANWEIKAGISTLPLPLTDPTTEPHLSKAFHEFIIPLMCESCYLNMQDKIQAKIWSNKYDDVVAELRKLAKEADDDGPVAFSPGNPIIDHDNVNIRFWL